MHDCSFVTSVKLPYKTYSADALFSAKIKMWHEFESKGSYFGKLKIGMVDLIARNLKLH